MAKPIFVINFPGQTVSDDIKSKIISGLEVTYPELHSDYHVICTFHSMQEKISFEAFNTSDIPPITIEELQEKLLNIK